MRAPVRLLPLVALAVAVANGCADDARIELLPEGQADSGAEASVGGTGGTTPCGGACTGERPHCDISQNRCVQCLKSTDCESAELACDPAGECTKSCSTDLECGDEHCDLGTQACVKCRVELGKTANPDCGGEYYCVLGECWDCLADTDCEPGQTCDPEEHHCSGTSG